MLEDSDNRVENFDSSQPGFNLKVKCTIYIVVSTSAESTNDRVFLYFCYMHEHIYALISGIFSFTEEIRIIRN